MVAEVVVFDFLLELFLLKSGLLGLFIYFISIFLLFKKHKTTHPMIENVNLLLFGTGVFLIFSNWVFMGIFNLSDNKAILIGLFFCFREFYSKSTDYSNVDTTHGG